MNDHVFIIAEAGDNHNGCLELAYKLVDQAVAAGADCVKFQTFITEEIISKNASKAAYQMATTDADESQFEMVKSLELSFNDFRLLKNYCDEKGIIFLSTPFDLPSIQFINSLNPVFIKIPSGEITNYPYLVAVAKTGKDIVMSTGMSEIYEIREAIDVLRANQSGKITLLQCNTEYPTPYQDVNLKALQSLKNEFGLDVGYSDHTLGIEVPIAAVALGATIIEKHFTLSRTMKGPDHQASLEPDELKSMVRSIRHIEMALGNGEKKVMPSEKDNRDIARKSITARSNIKAGEVFTEKNITTKRPGHGISAMRWNEIIGKQAIRDFNEDEQIEI